MEAELLLALYAAVVSTAVAAVQILQHFEGRRYNHITANRSLDQKTEFVTFRIANRSSGSVELHEVLVYNLGVGGEVGFHELVGQSVDLHKDEQDENANDGDDAEIARNQPLRLPLKLSSGESVCVVFCSDDAKKIIGPKLEHWIGSINSNLFLLEVTHSRNDKPARLYFEMDRKYLTQTFSNWQKLMPRFRQWRYRPLDKTFR